MMFLPPVEFSHARCDWKIIEKEARKISPADLRIDNPELEEIIPGEKVVARDDQGDLKDWEIRYLDKNGQVELVGKTISEKDLENVILDTGHVLVFRNLFALAGSGGLCALAVGASTTTAVATQTSLVRELSGNATRKSIVSLDDDGLQVSDIIQDVTVISSITYRWKLTCKALYDSGDANNGNQFGEFALVNKLGYAASGEIFYNRLVDGAPTTKSASNSIEAQITVRYG